MVITRPLLRDGASPFYFFVSAFLFVWEISCTEPLPSGHVQNIGKAGASLDDAVAKLKENGEAGETIGKLEKTVKDITSQASKLSRDYDLPAKAKQALGAAGELADTAIDKGIELEKEFKVTEKVKEAVQKSVGKNDLK